MENFDTKQKIFAISKKLFYENGYHRTSLQTISNELDISHSVIFHYYKNKKDLLTQIVKSYHDLSEAVINELNLDLNILEKHILIQKLSMMPFIQDKKLFRLIYECIVEDVTENIFFDYMGGIMQRIDTYRKTKLEDSEKIFLFSTFIGLSKEFIANLYKGCMPLTEETIDKFLIYLMKLLFQASEKEIVKTITDINKFIDIVHYHNLEFTIIQDYISDGLSNMINYENYDYMKIDFVTKLALENEDILNIKKYNKVIALTKNYEISHYLNILQLNNYLNDFIEHSQKLFKLINESYPTIEFMPIINVNNMIPRTTDFNDFEKYNINVLKSLDALGIPYYIDDKKYVFAFFILYKIIN